MSEPFAQHPYGPYAEPEPPRRRGRHALGLTVTAVVALAAGAGAGAALSHGSAPSDSVKPTSNTAPNATPAQSQIASRVDPAVVDVAAPLANQEGTDYGTGIVLTANGEVLTNNHVIEGAASLKVTDVGNGKTYKANVVGYDESTDVAVLQLAGASGLTTVSAGDSATVKTGDSVVALGNACGVGGTPSAAAGTVTALGQSINASDEGSGLTEHLTGMIEMNANILPGDSGGPLVNAHGQVIGMDTAALSACPSGGSPSGGSPVGGNGYGYGFGGSGSSGHGYGYGYSGGPSGGNGSSNSGQAITQPGYSIPINTALSVAREIEAGQASSTVHIGATAFLGVQIASASYQDSSGVTIQGAESGTPASNAGLTGGDDITSIAGQRVSSYTSIQQVLERYHPGDKIGIGWTDTDGQQHTATVTLSSGAPA